MVLCKEPKVFPELQIRQPYCGQQSKRAKEGPAEEPGAFAMALFASNGAGEEAKYKRSR